MKGRKAVSVLQGLSIKGIVLFWLACLVVVIVVKSILPDKEPLNPQILGIEFSLERGDKQFFVRRIDVKDSKLEMSQYDRILRKALLCLPDLS